MLALQTGHPRLRNVPLRRPRRATRDQKGTSPPVNGQEQRRQKIAAVNRANENDQRIVMEATRQLLDEGLVTAKSPAARSFGSS